MSSPATHYVSLTTPNRRPQMFWLISAGTALGVFLLTLVAPVAAATQHDQVAQSVYHAFKMFCHQIPERSFFIAGHQLAICSRCTGLYAGFAFTILFYPLVRSLRVTVAPPVKWLFLAAVPLLVDFSLTFFGIWENTHTSRLLTGLLLGNVAVFFVMPGLAELSLRHQSRPKQGSMTFTLASPESTATAPSDYSTPERRI
jgi:uncharacterized membrane protein